jgi:hypothetical protein
MPIEVRGKRSPQASGPHQAGGRPRGSPPRADDGDELETGDAAREMYAAACAVVARFDMLELAEAVESLQERRIWEDSGPAAQRFFLELERELTTKS